MLKKTKLEIHPKPRQPIQINRPLIITIAIVMVTVLLLAVIGALTVTNRAKTSTTASAIKTSDKSFVLNPALKDLPESYSDIEAIKRYSSDLSSSQLASLLQRFNELQDEYALLKRQLLTKNTLAPEKPVVDQKLQEAMKSSLTFGSLGSGIENLVGPQEEGKSRSLQSSGNQETPLVATPQQEEFFKKQAENAQKLAVMKGKDNPEDIYDLHNMVKPASKYQIQAGTLIPATLITAVDTTLPGPLIAQVRSPIYDTVTGKYLLIPKGSKLLGEYETRIAAGQRRVLLAFNRIVRPDGSSILLGKATMGVDAIGQSGVEGNVDNHWARVLGAATISTILNVGAGIAGDKGGGDNGFLQNARGRAFSGGAAGISQAGQSIVNRDINISPTITLPSGHQFYVAVRRDMIMAPYKPRN